jgi:hypothetical protein
MKDSEIGKTCTRSMQGEAVENRLAFFFSKLEGKMSFVRISRKLEDNFKTEVEKKIYIYICVCVCVCVWVCVCVCVCAEIKCAMLRLHRRML